MKKIWPSLFLVLVLINCSAQFQRMLIPAGEHMIKRIAIIPVFCIDDDLDTPTPNNNFENFSSNIYITRDSAGKRITRPAMEVAGKWLNIRGNNDINTLRVLKADPDDGASYTISIRNGNGYVGSKESYLTELPSDARIDNYRSQLNTINDPLIRKLARQQIIWDVFNDEDSPKSMLVFLTRIRQSNQVNMLPVNAITDASIKNYIKSSIYYDLFNKESLPGINTSVQRMLQVREISWRRINSIPDEELKLLAKKNILEDLRTGSTLKEVNDKIENIAKINEHQLQTLKLIKDTELQTTARRQLFADLVDQKSLVEINNKLSLYVQQDADIQKINSFFKGNNQLIEDIRSQGIDRTTIATMINDNKIKWKTDSELTEQSINLIQLLSEISNKFAKYHLSKYELSLIDNIKSFQTDNQLTISGYPDEQFLLVLEKYDRTYDILKSYYKNGKSEQVFATTNNGSQSTYVIKLDDQIYVFQYNGKLKPFDNEVVNLLESEYLLDIKARSYTNGITFMGLGSKTGDNTIKAQLGGKSKEIVWSNLHSYDEILDQVTDDINMLPAGTKIILARDLFQKALFTSPEETGKKSVTGKYITNRTWINYMIFIKELKTKFPGKEFYLADNFNQDQAVHHPL